MASTPPPPRRGASPSGSQAGGHDAKVCARVLAATAVVRARMAHAAAVARALQEQAVLASRRSPVLARFSPEYVRGATEVLAAVAAVGAFAFVVRSGTHRYRIASDVPRRLFHPPRTIHGYILNVSDGDGVRFYHTPWMRRLLFRKMRTLKKFSEETISVRLAGVDAPELSHYGLPGQKFGKVAKDWLSGLAHRRRASLQLLGQDQYNRVVGMVRVKSENPILRVFGLGRKNLSLELVKAGYAEVYRGPNAQYGGLHFWLERAEKQAIRNKLGFWSDKRELTPSDFKKKMRQVGANGKGNDQSMVLLPGPLLSRTLAVLEGLRSAATTPPPAKKKKKSRQKS